jgi:hypothetical protein
MGRIKMKSAPNQFSEYEIMFSFARLCLELELRRTHGVLFAATFLEDFEPEVRRAVSYSSAKRRRERNAGPP